MIEAKWEIDRVSTSQRVLAKINELHGPVAILLYGVDCALTTQVSKQINQTVQNLTHLSLNLAGRQSAILNDPIMTSKFREILRERKENLVLRIDPSERVALGLIVRNLRGLKVKNIVCVHVRPLAERFVGDIEKLRLWHQMELNPPRARDFSYYIPITEDAIHVFWCGYNYVECLNAFDAACGMDDISVTSCTSPGEHKLYQMLESGDARGACMCHYPMFEDPYRMGRSIQDVDVIVGSIHIQDVVNNLDLAVYAGKPFVNRLPEIPDELHALLRKATQTIPVFHDPYLMVNYLLPNTTKINHVDRAAVGQQLLEVAKYMAKQPLRPGSFYQNYDVWPEPKSQNFVKE